MVLDHGRSDAFMIKTKQRQAATQRIRQQYKANHTLFAQQLLTIIDMTG